MIAQRRAFKADRVHRLDDRVHVAFFHAPLIGDVVAHRVALKKVAIVQQDRVRGLGADVGDMRGSPGQPHRVDGAVAVIVIGKDVHVEVGRLHNAQVCLAGGSAGRERVQHHKRGSSGGRGQKGASAHGRNTK